MQQERFRKTTIFILAGILAAILLGVGQYQLYRCGNRIVQQSDRVLFHATSVREYITSALLERRYTDLPAAAAELQTLNENLLELFRNPIVPEQLKIPLTSRSDLSGITLLARQVAAAAEPMKIRALHEDLRLLNDGLASFRTRLADHVKDKMVGYQLLTIGVLVLALLAVSNISFLAYRRYVLPVLALRRQMESRQSGFVVSREGAWLAELVNRAVAQAGPRFDMTALFADNPLPVVRVEGDGRTSPANGVAEREFPAGGNGAAALAELPRRMEGGEAGLWIGGNWFNPIVFSLPGVEGRFVQLVPWQDPRAGRLREAALVLKGQLAGALCHEIGQACNIILNACQLVEEGCNVPIVRQISEQGERIADGVRLLCSVGCEHRGGRVLAPTVEVQEAVRLFGLLCRAEAVGLRSAIAGDIPEVEGEGGELRLVVLLACLVARQQLPVTGVGQVSLAATAGEELVIRISARPCGDEDLQAGEPMLDLCREVLAARGGGLDIERGQRREVTIELRLPLARRMAA
ncbi:MAG: hypothetical protein AB1568_06090 [Thermodesulfobacteriota bacterium]